jgi:sugar (pentulose or hexulose) kinase
MKYAIAVIDIGMTNKKVAVYDDTLRQISADYRGFEPVMYDGMETHNLAGMEAWFMERLADAARKWPIRALVVTAHGATFVCVGPDGKPCAPCFFYTCEPGEAFQRRFYDTFGDPIELQKTTGTPRFSELLNVAKGVFFLKENYADDFAKTKRLLLYPQYWGWRFTGRAGVEGTCIACHTYLLNQPQNTLSSVARKLGIAAIMPTDVRNSWDVLGKITPEFAAKTGLSPEVLVTMGIHDSNSSLLPHFAKRGEVGFVLNSTGTWCVVMNPVEHYGFRDEDLGKVVFFNQSAFKKPVKTAIFQGGFEFEAWTKILGKLHNRTDIPACDRALYSRVMREKRAFLMPEINRGSGQFPDSAPRVVEDGKVYAFADIAAGRVAPPVFKNYEEAVAILRLSLVNQTITAMDRAGLRETDAILTEGGWRKDSAYNELVSSWYAGNRYCLSDIAEATALGAAMTAKMALTHETLANLAADFTVEYREVPKSPLPELAAYREAWLRLAGQ